MNSLIGHGLILLGAGIAGCLLPLAIERPVDPNAPVVTSPHVAAAKRPPARSTAVDDGPQAGGELIRLLQRELARVGCYEGPITGAWGGREKGAMRAFLTRVNASLPVDRPDDILLHLLRGEERRVCASACADAPSTTAAECASSGASASAAVRSGQVPAVGQKPTAEPAIERPPQPTARAVPAARDVAGDGGGRLEENAERSADPQMQADAAHQGAAGDPGAPLARRAPSHPTQGSSGKASRTVRLLLRNIERSLAPLGMR
jgi:peptidoglycan hydrolase-like protein with peptidoglycan-binding domain